MTGIVDVITLLLGLSGFGLAPDPRASTPEASLQYAIADADLVVHLDAASVIPANYRRLTELASQPSIKASPELAKAVREVVTEVESARGLARMTTGIDLATDVSDVTAFVRLQPGGGEPGLVVAAHGKFSTQTIDKLSAIGHKPVIRLKNGGAWTDVDGSHAVAVTGDGVLLFGSHGLVGDRTRPDWRAPARGSGTTLGYAAELLAGKPVLAAAVTLSPAARDQAVAAIGGAGFASDALKRGKLATFAVYRDGIGWSWIDSTKAGLDEMTAISNGAIEVLRGSQISSRGFAKIVLGGLESYRSDRDVDELLRHRGDLATLLGDGTFKAKVDADARTLRLNVRLTGKSLSDVVPFGMILPLAAAGVRRP